MLPKNLFWFDQCFLLTKQAHIIAHKTKLSLVKPNVTFMFMYHIYLSNSDLHLLKLMNNFQNFFFNLNIFDGAGRE